MAPKTDASLQELPSEAWVPWAQEWTHQSGKELQEKFVGRVLEDAELFPSNIWTVKTAPFPGDVLSNLGVCGGVTQTVSKLGSATCSP